MTLIARQVLADCRIALQLLEDEKDLQRWRIHWAAAVMLTRAVGHVLDKVDAARGDNALKTASDAAYKSWNDPSSAHAIFREFIEPERNNIVKEYAFNVHPLEEVEVLVDVRMQNMETGEIVGAPQVIPLGDNIYRPHLSEYREGDDCRDILTDALEWWDEQLDRVDRTAAALRTATAKKPRK